VEEAPVILTHLAEAVEVLVVAEQVRPQLMVVLEDKTVLQGLTIIGRAEEEALVGAYHLVMAVLVEAVEVLV
jgi:hypothetical protein